MAGEHRLEGETGVKALEILDEVTRVLEKYGVEYSLDCGTLLGVVRENRLLPWDNDMDLCVCSSQLKKLKKCMLPLWLKGYRIRLAKNYESSGPLQAKAARILKVRNRHKWVHRGKVLVDIFIKHDGGDGYHYLMVGGAADDYIVQRMPSKYLQELTTIEFNNKAYPIPADYEGYLSYRYGDWRTPVKEWDYATQDQSRIDG